MVKILAFDTSSKLLSVALKTDRGLYETFISRGFRHSENLTLMIKNLAETAEMELKELDLIVCTSGPGSFTGLRIGISTAKGLSFALSKPMVIIPSMDMMAEGLGFFNGAVLPVLDARKKRFYAAVYENGERKSEYLDASPEEIEAALEGYERVLLTGPDAPEFNSLTGGKYIVNPAFDRANARFLIQPGIDEYLKNGGASEACGPLYLRKSEAEIGITR